MVSAALTFIVLDAILWLGFGVIVAADLHPALPDQPVIRRGMAILALGAAGGLVVLSALLHRRNRIAYILALAALLFIALLAAVDEFGWVDLAVLASHVVPVVLLLRARGWFFPRRES